MPIHPIHTRGLGALRAKKPRWSGRQTDVCDSPADQDSILSAAEVPNLCAVGGRLFGKVASELIAVGGTHCLAVCIDTGSGTGCRVEHSAIAAMVTAGEFRIKKIVAVWRDEEGRLYVLPPCARCREFIRQMNPTNIDTKVVIDLDHCALLHGLLPAHQWPLALDSS